jgi:hypothetical protein
MKRKTSINERKNMNKMSNKLRKKKDVKNRGEKREKTMKIIEKE